MKIKYVGPNPIRFNDIPLESGSVITVSDKKAGSILKDGRFEEVKDEQAKAEKSKPATKSKAKKKADEPEIETTEEEI